MQKRCHDADDQGCEEASERHRCERDRPVDLAPWVPDAKHVLAQADVVDDEADGQD